MIAIDFGTTNSSVAVLREGDAEPTVQAVEFDQESYDSNVLPSAVCECRSSECRGRRHTYGHEALRHGCDLPHDSELLHEMKLYFDRSTIEPPTLVESTLLTVLREENGVLNPVTIKQKIKYYKDEVPLEPRQFVPGTAKLISEIIGRVNLSPDDRNELVIGFPVNFHAKGVKQLREAAKVGAFGKNAGYDRVFMYLEPLASARSYMKIAQGNVLVLDYGGGTLDITKILHENRPRERARSGLRGRHS